MNNKWLIDCDKAAELPRTDQQELFSFLNSVVMKQKLQPDELTTFYDWLNKVSGKAIKKGSCPDCIGHTISGLRMTLKQSLQVDRDVNAVKELLQKSLKHETDRGDVTGNKTSDTAERVLEPKKVQKKGKAQGKKSGSATDETPMK